MARTKQTARRSTGGKAPKESLANKAARNPRGQEPERDAKPVAFKAWKKDLFLIQVEGQRPGDRHEMTLKRERLLPHVAGFLKALGTRDWVTSRDLQTLTNDDVLVPLGGRQGESPNDSEEGNRPFYNLERIHLKTDRNSESMYLYGSNRHPGELWLVNLLHFKFSIRNLQDATFSQYASAEPESDEIPECVRSAAVELRVHFEGLRTRVMSKAGFGKDAIHLDEAFPIGARGDSTTEIVGALRPRVYVPFLQKDFPTIPCSVAAVANAAYREGREKQFSDRLADLGHEGEYDLQKVKTLKNVGAWILANKSYFSGGVVPIQLQRCLPEFLRYSSLSSKVSFKGNRMTVAHARLSWVLEQTKDIFVVQIMDSDHGSSHVVAVNAEKGYIMDSEAHEALPFNASGFNGCCAGQLLCIGLFDVRRLVRVAPARRRRGRKRPRSNTEHD